ncbi:MAG: hypothetical protein ABIJ15_03570 [bacterium]
MKSLSAQIIDRYLLLYLIDKTNKSEEITGKVKLQKLTFLCEWELNKEEYKGFNFMFFRHYNGPFSKELACDYDFLAENNFVNKNKYTLTERGKKLLNSFFSDIVKRDYNKLIIKGMDRTILKWARYTGEQLMDIVYKFKVKTYVNPDRELMIKDIPAFIDIIGPGLINYKQEFKIGDNLLEDLNYNFETTDENKRKMKMLSNISYKERFAQI